MSRRVFLHIGAPKTGTTYLQDRLTINNGTLSRHGVHFPSSSALVNPALFHFRAALDLQGQDWGGPPGHAAGAWDALVRRIKRRSGTFVVSHEIFAAARPDAVAKLKRDLAGTELHVVYTARDLARQVPAAWQESIKQGRRWSYESFLRRVVGGKSWFSRAFDLPTVLNTWGAGLPPSQVHVVTVPSRDVAAAEPDLLWHRFCTVIGIDPAWAPKESDRTNPSLGIAETQLIRRLNRRMGRTARGEASYDTLVRTLLAEQALVDRAMSVPVLLPPARLPWAIERTAQWTEWIEQSGVDLVGDLADLEPQPIPDDQIWRHPDNVSPKKQLGAALDALTAMTQEAARRPDPNRQLAAKVRTGARRLRNS